MSFKYNNSLFVNDTYNDLYTAFQKKQESFITQDYDLIINFKTMTCKHILYHSTKIYDVTLSKEKFQPILVEKSRLKVLLVYVGIGYHSFPEKYIKTFYNMRLTFLHQDILPIPVFWANDHLYEIIIEKSNLSNIFYKDNPFQLYIQKKWSDIVLLTSPKLEDIFENHFIWFKKQCDLYKIKYTKLLFWATSGSTIPLLNCLKSKNGLGQVTNTFFILSGSLYSFIYRLTKDPSIEIKEYLKDITLKNNKIINILYDIDPLGSLLLNPDTTKILTKDINFQRLQSPIIDFVVESNLFLKFFKAISGLIQHTLYLKNKNIMNLIIQLANQ